MKNKYALLLIPLMLCLPLLQNCGPGECEEYVSTHTKYSIREDYKKKIPFTGTDTLTYISTDGDTAVLYGQGKKVYFESVQQNYGGDPKCPKTDYDDLETIIYSYKESQNKLNEIRVKCAATASLYNRSDAYVLIGNASYTASLPYMNDPNYYTDTVTINSITYSAVKISNGTNFPYSYNYQYGILRINTANKIWLKKI
jgi:hypothetical protein